MSTPSVSLPSIAEVAAAVQAPAVVPAHAAAPDAGSLKGGTASDPTLGAQAPAPEASKEVAVEPTPAPAPEPKKVEPKKDPQSSRFGALARKEKELRQQQQAVAAQLKAAEAREAALKEKEARWDSAKKRPVQALKELGFSYSDVTADLLGNYKEPEVDPMDLKMKPWADKVDAVEPKVEELTRQINELRAALTQKEQQEAYDTAMGEIKRAAAANPEKYELISQFGDEAVDLVKDVIVEFWNENKKMLDYSEACDIVESYYEREYLDRLTSTKKLKSKFPTPAPEPSKPSPKKEAKEPSTLTNSLSSGSQAKVDLDSMSKQEAIAYLAKKLQFRES